MFGAPNSGCGPRGILMAGDFQSKGDSLFEATMFQPDGICSKDVMCDRLNYTKDEPKQTISLLWDVKHVMPRRDEQYFLLDAEMITGGHVPFFRADAQTVPIPISSGVPDRVKILELFSGGYGGWSAASGYLSEKFGKHFRVVGVEHDIEAAYAYAISREAQIWNGETVIPIDAIAESNHDLVLCADVKSLSWVPSVAKWSPDCICVSSPCQPWSGAGSGQGLLTEDGECLLQAIALAKLMRPRFLLLEQVSAFMSHPHKSHVMSMLRWAGFQLKWNKIVELAEQCPVQRARWLGFAERVADMTHERLHFQFWQVQPKMDPTTYGSILAEDLTLDERLNPTEDMIRLSSRPDMLPPAKRRHIDSDNALATRCYTKHQCLPTFMASYGAQHQFSEQWLKTKGLLSHYYMSETGHMRFWHPIEVLLHHGLCTRQFVHGDWSIAWKHAGNQISVPHALLMLTNMLRMAFSSDDLQVPRVLKEFHQDHLKADDLCIVQCSQGQIVSKYPLGWSEKQFDNIENFRTCLKNGNIPEGLAWSINGLEPYKTQEGQIVASVPSIANTAVDCESTCSFYATATACFTSPKAFFEFDYDQEIGVGAVLGVWDHVMTVQPDDSQLVLIPNKDWSGDAAETPKVLVLVQPGVIRILKPDVNSLHQAAPHANVFFDQFGVLSHNVFDKSVIVFECDPCPIVPCWSQSTAKFVMAMSCCQTYVRVDPESHDLSLTFQGPSSCVNTVISFWNSVILKPFLDLVGLTLACARNKAGATIMLKYQDGRCPLPFSALKIQLVVFAMRALFARIVDDKGILVRIKWMARPIWQGRLPRNTTGATILQILHSATKVHSGDIPYRMICEGKPFSDEYQIAECAHPNKTSPITIHTVLRLHGGGVPGTKQGHKIQIKNAFAGLLLSEGYDLGWIGEALDKMIQKAPIKDVNEIVHLPNGPQKLQGLLNFLKECDVQIPKIKPTVSSQAALNAKRKKTPVLPHPDHYAVIPGSLLNEDGSEASQTMEFGCQLTGFFVATHQFAVPWLRTGEKIATDELAMLLMGELPVETTLPTIKTTLPFRDEKGRDVLIACQLVQFGDKTITPKQLDQHLIASDNTSLMAITLWKEDWEDQWLTICQNPYKFIKTHANPEDLVVSIWGRSFRKGKTPTSSHDCTSIQMHCLLKTDKMATFLARSGYNMIWLTPKMENGRPHEQWKLIWLDKECDIQQATVISARLQDAAGLVRSNHRYAIRVPASNFGHDWTQVHPNVPVPDAKDTSIIFKLQSLPFGTTRDMLEAWSKHVRWDFKPLRAVGPRAWIVGAGQMPEPKQYAFNGHPILIQEIQSRQVTLANPIVAGPKPGQRQESKASSSAQPIGLMNDPWATYVGTKGQFVPACASASNQPNTGRAPAGPTADRFALQDDKIADLQKVVQQLQKNQDEHGLMLAQAQEEAKQSEAAVRSHVDQQMNNLKNELNNSFVGALRIQSQNFESSLNEIKSLILDRNKRKTPEEEDAHMQPQC